MESMPVTLLISLAIMSSPHVVSTPIEGSLERSLVRKVPSDGPALAAQIARLLKWEGDIVRNIHRGDHLRIVYNPDDEYGIKWNDETIGLKWNYDSPIISKRDLSLPALKDQQFLPKY